jgi:hypothetical protein
MAIAVGSTLQLVNLAGTAAEIGSYIVQNGIGPANMPFGIQGVALGSLVAFYYK